MPKFMCYRVMLLNIYHLFNIATLPHAAPEQYIILNDCQSRFNVITYSEKNLGPSMKPWGTPYVMVFAFDFDSLNLKNCDLACK